MISKISIILLILSFCLLVHGKRKRIFSNDDNDLELSDDKAQMFLRTMLKDDDDDGELLGKRESGTDCVKCKFKLNPCCKPNVCVKKFPWNECMEIKTRGIGK